jgi:hypothetical protein
VCFFYLVKKNMHAAPLCVPAVERLLPLVGASVLSFETLLKKTWERMLLIFLTVDAALSKGRPTARKEGVELIVAL